MNQATRPKLKILARPEIHQKVLRLLAAEVRAPILDVPSGTGALAVKLQDLGFPVCCCDINPDSFAASGIEIVSGDFNGRLPFPDRSFQYVVCLEGLEHLENAFNALREFARLLKRGGKLYLSLPNYLNLERRLKFLVTCSFTKPVSQTDFRDRSGSDTSMMHLNTLGYPVLKFMLEASGLKVLRLEKDRAKPKMKLFLPLLGLIKLYTLFWPAKAKERYWLEEVNSNYILSGGNSLIIIAERVA